MEGLTISQVAKAAQVHLETVRYYERRGLLASPPRTEGGYRKYGYEAVEDIQLIRRAQALGFTLEEIKKMLNISKNEHSFPVEEMQQFAIAKIAEIQEKVSQLNKLKSMLELAVLVPDAADRYSKEDCPVLNIVMKGEKTDG